MTTQLTVVRQRGDDGAPEASGILQEKERQDGDQDEPRHIGERAHERQRRSLNRFDGSRAGSEHRLIDGPPQFERDSQTLVIS